VATTKRKRNVVEQRIKVMLNNERLPKALIFAFSSGERNLCQGFVRSPYQLRPGRMLAVEAFTLDAVRLQWANMVKLGDSFRSMEAAKGVGQVAEEEIARMEYVAGGFSWHVLHAKDADEPQGRVEHQLFRA
jgi:hypothetical protein